MVQQNHIEVHFKYVMVDIHAKQCDAGYNRVITGRAQK